ncbi:MAG: 5-formyltetrahydrofolate cyclo-ligase [Oscillospiraceae bacterium]|nr:5-formyltetrahydrofolate cyclo-ligase [Oscillospiraceae bacterium]
MNKKELRAIVREKKRALTSEQIDRYSAALAKKLFAHPAYLAAKSVYGYLPFNEEVRMGPILRRAQADGKRVAVPKVYGDEMRFLWLDDLSAVASGYYGIPEPIADEPIADDEQALVLMPGLAFDREGHRCGYGGGFYDRYLEQHTQHKTLALCYDFQVFDALETEDFDIPVDVVICSSEEES